ncbi:MAG TPA: FAD-dependent oxidoreductase [Acidimicrobiales bacterium]|nr:FAD-dependent oxidoreductase [Acidimicrobiales bacterium]
MADILVIGGGVVGLGTAMLLAEDGHQVTVLERDPAPPPPTPEEAWETWERKGVNQFRLPHFFLAPYRAILDHDLPRVAKAVDAAGGLRQNPYLEVPEQIRGPEQPGDSDLGVLTARRPVMEAALASVAPSTPGLGVRRGVAVSGLVTGPSARPGVAHVVGVRTDAGEEIRADLVVDMMGRRSPLPRWLEEAGARPPVELLEDCGFMYYGRHFRSRNGALPFAFGPPIQHLGSISSLTLVADNSTWSLVIVTSAKDKALYPLREPERWDRLVRSLPLVAHWLDGDPIDDRVQTMAKIEDRHRGFLVDGEPVVTGVVAVADAWACSNPSVGRGASIGMMHGRLLRDTLRDAGLDDPYRFASAFHRSTEAEIEPWFRWTLFGDRHRLAQVDAAINGDEYRPGDEKWESEQALTAAAGKDPDLLRAMIRANLLVEPLDKSLTPALIDKALQLGGNWREEPVPAPPRPQLVALAND